MLVFAHPGIGLRYELHPLFTNSDVCDFIFDRPRDPKHALI
jgi:hypothetical protein